MAGTWSAGTDDGGYPSWKDVDMDWQRHLMYIPILEFQTFVAQNGVDDGAPVIAEVGSLGLVGGQVNAAGDSFSHIMRFPRQWNVEETIGVRIYWTANGTLAATDQATWLFTYDQADPDEALAAPATALDTVLVSDAYGSTTNNIVKRTARGIINADTFDATARDGIFAFNVECDALDDGATTFAADEVFLLGVEFDYVPTLCNTGPGGVFEENIAND